ncbi:CDGSH iron-sulfur domain-containing protein [Arthrobacter crystallopoietes]|uniref:CDGSH iron-sulfur domain-containing protein n=1 Tax=Crystallibacter crystallopoietes TaxID=37928 RepID=UPI003D1F7746
MAVRATNPEPAATADQPEEAEARPRPEPAAAAGRRPEEPTVEPLPKPAAATVVACPNGPLLLRGDIEILTETGEPVPRLRRTVALCRCGASSIKPYCDGTHKLTGFTTGPTPSAAGPVQDG